MMALRTVEAIANAIFPCMLMPMLFSYTHFMPENIKAAVALFLLPSRGALFLLNSHSGCNLVSGSISVN